MTVSETSVEAYLAKPQNYFQGARADYVAELPNNPEASILELGCAEGGTGALALKENKAARYVGIELHEPSVEIARTKLTDVLIGDVETMDLPFPLESFDALIISEVLEHLQDPWSVVARLGAFLRPGGIVLASSPNISHYKVILRLVCGGWDLTDRGAMDRTHLRWFTPRTYAQMFEEAGFVIEEVRPITPFSAKTRAINALTFNAFRHLFMVQTSIRARRPAR